MKTVELTVKMFFEVPDETDVDNLCVDLTSPRVTDLGAHIEGAHYISHETIESATVD